MYDPKQYWNDKAEKFADDPLSASRASDPELNHCIGAVQRQALDLAVRAMPKQHVSDLLDFGCGAGVWTERFEGLADRYTGVDISEGMIDLCRKHYPDKEFLSYDGATLPFEDARFDAIFSLAVLHHNRHPEQEGLLDELSRCLTPGGFLFLFEGVGPEPVAREFPRTRGDWLETVSRHGFDVVSHRHYVYMPIIAMVDRMESLIGWRPSFEWRLSRLDARLAPRLSAMPLIRSRKIGRMAMCAVKRT